MSDRREARLLLAILCEDWARVESLQRASPARPRTLVDLARACDVHPWVHHLLARAGLLELFGPEVRDALAGLRHKCRVDNAVLLARAEQVLDLLLGHRIVPVALKGLDFLHRFYDRFDERTIDDVDLLVAPHELSAALRALEVGGYRTPPEPERTHWLRSSYQMPLTSPGSPQVLVELHWGLAQDRRYTVDVGAVLDRARPLEIAGRCVRRLEDHDAAAHLALHDLQHYFDRRLKWTIEFQRLTRQPGFDWDELVRRLEAWGGRAAGAACLDHVRKLFPGRIGEQARRALPVAWWRRALTLPLRSSHPLDLFRGTRRRKVQLYLAAALMERPKDLPRYLFHRQVRDTRQGSVEGPGRWPESAGEDGDSTNRDSRST
jgi:hypothetical protein